MSNVACRPSVVLLGVSAAALGAFALARGGDADLPTVDEAHTVAPADVAALHVASAAPRLNVPDTDDTIAVDPDAAPKAHDEIADPADFAFVVSVDGVNYLRLSRDELATARGNGVMSIEDGTVSVVAPVATSALPEPFRAWADREVLVDGYCHARVVGFAEISRVVGDRPIVYDENEELDEDSNPVRAVEEWTVESVVEDNVMLAARLDGCPGTWARAATRPDAAVASLVADSDLEAAGEAALLAHAGAEIEKQWKDSGGEGDWLKGSSIATTVFKHALTGESWLFVRAQRDDGIGCGEPYVSHMAVFRTGQDGTLRHVARLDYVTNDIQDVVDIDGDGQPELVVGEGYSSQLVDLTNAMLDHISVASHDYGCGC